MAEATSDNAFDNYDLRAEAPEARTPNVRFAFEFPELLEAFRPFDKTAASARKISRRQGLFAVFLVMIALMMASAAPLMTALDHGAHLVLGYLSTGLGLVGAALGFLGLHRGSARRVWLRARVQTEVIRLFHFYYMAARLPEIAGVDGDPGRRAEYLNHRRATFLQLLKGPLADPEAELGRIIAREKTFGPDDLVIEMAPSGRENSETADAVFAAWRKLRFDWQLGYCEAKLAHRALKGRLSSRQTEDLFGAFAWSCIAVVVALHLLQIGVEPLHLSRDWIEAGVVWTALAALAGRALEDGLQPQRDVERYEQYRSNILVAKERLDAASTFSARLEVVRAFERTSLEEMRVFMRTHARARFLL